MKTTLASLLALLMLFAAMLTSSLATDKHTRLDHIDGEGSFSMGTPTSNVMIIWDTNDHNILKRHKPAGSDGILIWQTPTRKALGNNGYPIPMSFSQEDQTGALNRYLSNSRSAEHAYSCPGNWVMDQSDADSRCNNKAAGETVPVTERFQCSDMTNVIGDVPTVTRQRDYACPGMDDVNNTRCTGWNVGNWSPSRSAKCNGVSFTQRRSVSKTPAGCSGTPSVTRPLSLRTKTGTKTTGNCAQCDDWITGSWSPASDSYCTTEIKTQYRTVSKSPAGCQGIPNGAKPASSQTKSGTKCCGSATSWREPTSAVCDGVNFTQTRTNSCGQTESRAATGTKYCPAQEPCVWITGSWSPDPADYCKGQSITLRRSVTKGPQGCAGEPTNRKPNSIKTDTGTKPCNAVCYGRAISGQSSNWGGVCIVQTRQHGQTSGSCSAGYANACNYRCNNGAWTKMTNDCTGYR